MLVLTRKAGQRIQIGDDVVVVINSIAGNRVKIGVEAPRDMLIRRGELPPQQESTETVPKNCSSRESLANRVA